MEPRHSDQVSAGGSDQSRREALLRFGRYAAMAPTAMVLLQPRDSLAKPDKNGRGGNSNKGGKGDNGNKGGKGYSDKGGKGYKGGKGGGEY